ncbi:MAG TPA: DEAD/DEAH box helicase [Tissierellaceae bacterium]
MLKYDDLDRLEQHWAVAAIPKDVRESCFREIEKIIVQKSVGNQIEFNFSISNQLEDEIRKIAAAYELAAIENIGSMINQTNTTLDRGVFIAASWKAYELYRSMEIPDDYQQKIFFVLHISAIAYCGERWNDLRRWYAENNNKIKKNKYIPQDHEWDMHMLTTLYECWVSLFTKDEWAKLNEIQSQIVELRQKQSQFEKVFLESQGNLKKPAAFRLLSIYHWAKCTELLALYITQGEPANITTQLDKHFEAAIEGATLSGDPELEVILYWLYCASRQMIESSIWWIARTINSKTTDFVKHVTKARALFEMLPPQKAAIREQGLLDQASTAIVVEMPTSGGKTLLAEFKILQALNQFAADKGWVAYVAPTRALVSQITRRLRKDFGPKIKVEQLSAAVDIDTFEEMMLSDKERSFDVLVATPEKLNLVIRNKRVPRPLALVVMDEAHNIEDDERGLRIELLLATVKSDCPTANFLLLMPYVENAHTLSKWLSSDISSGKAISIGSTPWQPNERIVGLYRKSVINDDIRGNWQIKFKTLATTPKTINFDGEYSITGTKHFGVPQSSVNKTILTAAMAKTMSERGTSLAIGRTINDSWNMARRISNELDILNPIPEQILLVQQYLKSEISPDFELVDMLSKGVGVHNAGLSDEARQLMEWLAEEGVLRVLCATTTVAQGINFPVSSVFMQSIYLSDDSYGRQMKPREFWNLAGRAGRIGHSSVGVIGIACEDDEDEAIITSFVREKTGELISRLVSMINDLYETGKLFNLNVIYNEEWTDFRCYIAHMCNEKESLDEIISDMEQLLRNTYGYNVLKSTRDGKKAKVLLDIAKAYATKLKGYPKYIISMADQTGFSPEGINAALREVRDLRQAITVDNLESQSIFGDGSELANLYGIMLRLPQLRQLAEIAGSGMDRKRIAAITTDWVSGKTIKEIAMSYFTGNSDTDKITNACRAIYKQIANYSTWGLSVLTKAITKLSGIDFDSLPDEKKREINSLPAMIYHGVNTPEAVLMRMNAVPRSIAHQMGKKYAEEADKYTVQEAREFIKSLDVKNWDDLRDKKSFLSGKDYKDIWELLAGEA